MTKVPAQQPRQKPCKIAFIGEAPGSEEVEQGKPLVGPSGVIFNAMLRAANLDRADYFVGNVFDEKAPLNDVSPWIRDPEKWAAALQRLAGELADARPDVIVPLGGTALRAFTGSDQIMQARGAPTAATQVAPGTKLVPTVHPAFVLRAWKWYGVAVADFIRAAAEADRGPELFLPSRELWLSPTLADLEEFTRHIVASDLLSVDIETGWGQMTCIGFAPSVERAIVVPFVDLRRNNRSYWTSEADEVRALLVVKEWLASPVPKLGQNFAGYDWMWLRYRYGLEVNNLQHDTRLLHHALYPELPKDLAFLGASYTDQGPWKMMKPKRGDKRDD